MSDGDTETARTRLVDSFFGIDGRGDCLCDPYMPLGLVRPGPDTEPQETSGYRTGRPLVRFSQNHVSGTGGGGRYGNIGLLPYSGDFRRGLEPRTIADEDGAVGRYACTLQPSGERAWLRHDEIAQGGTLELDLADGPAGFGTQPPPSGRYADSLASKPHGRMDQRTWPAVTCGPSGRG